MLLSEALKELKPYIEDIREDTEFIYLRFKRHIILNSGITRLTENLFHFVDKKYTGYLQIEIKGKIYEAFTIYSISKRVKDIEFIVPTEREIAEAKTTYLLDSIEGEEPNYTDSWGH